ncbi:MAG: transcription termination/antitermination protein NusG [Lachnospiraceae bacterium]|nr:transcription termination/antitermination protein NusG [Lachnospiraceae bacterium]
MAAEDAKWYVVHTYSGYENKVKANIEKAIENRNMQDRIFEVSVPLQNVVEFKDGARKEVQKKMFPGYVLIRMIMDDDTWYVVRNTRGVTGFVGPGSKPVPLTQTDLDNMMVRPDEISVEFEVGDVVTIINGSWENSSAIVKEINTKTQTVKVGIDMFGKETLVELDFTDVKIDN